MQVGRKFKLPHIVAMSIVTAMFVGCSGSQQDQEALENEYSQYGGNYDNYGTGNQSNNYGGESSDEYGSNEYANYNAADGEAYNSDVGNDTDEYASMDVENTATGTVAATLDGSGGYGTASPVNATPVNYGTPAPVAAPAPVAGGPTAPIPGGRVRYVVEGGAQILDQAGNPVGSLQQGDHPLTWEENGLYRITQGMYVTPTAVSDKGIGRPMGGNMWK